MISKHSHKRFPINTLRLRIVVCNAIKLYMKLKELYWENYRKRSDEQTLKRLF